MQPTNQLSASPTPSRPIGLSLGLLIVGFLALIVSALAPSAIIFSGAAVVGSCLALAGGILLMRRSPVALLLILPVAFVTYALMPLFGTDLFGLADSASIVNWPIDLYANIGNLVRFAYPATAVLVAIAGCLVAIAIPRAAVDDDRQTQSALPMVAAAPVLVGHTAAGEPVYSNNFAQPAASRTNTMAIMALCFGVMGGILGIVFGHIALSQIKRTGEQGRGMAIAGLVLGYISLAVVIAWFVFLAVFLNSMSSY